MSSVSEIRAYFESDPRGRKVTMDEFKALSSDERAELALISEVTEAPKAAAA